MDKRLLIGLWLALTAATLHSGPVPIGKPVHYPDWWFERDVIPRLPAHATNPTPIWPDHYPPADDYAVANLGQLKALATAAAAEFSATLPEGDAPTITDLVSPWLQAPASGVARDDFAALNQGQLKTVAAPFYWQQMTLGL